MDEIFRYHELNREGRERATIQARQRHPAEAESDTLITVLVNYIFDQDGWILYGTGEGQDPEYYGGMLAN